MGFYEGKNVLVAGGTGLIGKPLVNRLLEEGANVRVVSMDDPSRANPNSEYLKLDLTNYHNCEIACEGQDYVFNLLGIKGSPKMTLEKPANFLVPVLQFNTNLMEAARKEGTERFLFTSTIGVYQPAEILREDDVFKTLPSENDLFGGYAKRSGELQARAYKIQHGWDKTAIVRPANVYGPFDNFDVNNAMVIPSLIKRAVDGENPLKVGGDGSPIRDFIYSEDVAEGMLVALEKAPGPDYPLNLGSGERKSIKELANIIVNNIEGKPSIKWDPSMPRGDKIRLMDVSRAKSLGWNPKVSLEEGVRRTMDWYKENKDIVNKRYNIFE